jgi:hypothetical protein
VTWDQLAILLTACITATTGLLGTLLGGWVSQRAAVSSKVQEEIANSRSSLVSLAAVLVDDHYEDEQFPSIVQSAATAVIGLGYSSATAVRLLQSVQDWKKFERGSFPRRRAQEENALRA